MNQRKADQPAAGLSGFSPSGQNSRTNFSVSAASSAALAAVRRIASVAPSACRLLKEQISRDASNLVHWLLYPRACPMHRLNDGCPVSRRNAACCPRRCSRRHRRAGSDLRKQGHFLGPRSLGRLRCVSSRGRASVAYATVRVTCIAKPARISLHGNRTQGRPETSSGSRTS